MPTKYKKTARVLFFFTLLLLAGSLAPAIDSPQPLKPRTAPPAPRFDRLHPNEEILDNLKGYAAAYPDWVRLESIGKTSLGGDTWLLTLTNPATGGELEKPAMYIDGATHANEVQGADTVLYTLDFMLKNYGRLKSVTRLMDRATFYFVPIVSWDSRNKWFHEPSTPSYPRSVQVAIDDDRDGMADEDGPEDLNGDGVITQMRKKVPLGQGDYKLDPEDPRRMVRVKADEGEQGNYILLGQEGIDNDGDGRVNEDSAGYIDPNRTWAYGWQPRYVQAGSTRYPLQIPETRNIAEWALGKPNIAAVQSFHNSGRMILRGPGYKAGPYDPSDVKVYDRIGKEGEKILPGYNYWVIWKDLYTAYGGTTDHFYGIHGAIAFTNELYGPEQDFDGDGKVSEEEKLKFNDRLTLGRMFMDWKEFDHPRYGKVEIGGYRSDTGRVPEGWMLQEDCHRNAAFVLFHASQLPEIRFGDVTVEKLGHKLWRVQAWVHNDGGIPTVTGIARKNKIHRPDLATLKGAKVLSSGVVRNRWFNQVRLQRYRPERLEVDTLDGHGRKELFFLVEGDGPVNLEYSSVKAGTIRTRVELK